MSQNSQYPLRQELKGLYRHSGEHTVCRFPCFPALLLAAASGRSAFATLCTSSLQSAQEAQTPKKLEKDRRWLNSEKKSANLDHRKTKEQRRRKWTPRGRVGEKSALEILQKEERQHRQHKHEAVSRDTTSHSPRVGLEMSSS